jgi:hypothetical protein
MDRTRMTRHWSLSNLLPSLRLFPWLCVCHWWFHLMTRSLSLPTMNTTRLFSVDFVTDNDEYRRVSIARSRLVYFLDRNSDRCMWIIAQYYYESTISSTIDDNTRVSDKSHAFKLKKSSESVVLSNVWLSMIVVELNEHAIGSFDLVVIRLWTAFDDITTRWKMKSSTNKLDDRLCYCIVCRHLSFSHISWHVLDVSSSTRLFQRNCDRILSFFFFFVTVTFTCQSSWTSSTSTRDIREKTPSRFVQPVWQAQLWQRKQSTESIPRILTLILSCRWNSRESE